MTEVGRTWLASAKIARKAGQWQTAYSAMLQAQQSKTRFTSIESAKLIKATDEPLRALKELENSMKLTGLLETSEIVDLTADEETTRMKAKVFQLIAHSRHQINSLQAHILRARWMNESQRYDTSIIYKMFQLVTELDKKLVVFASACPLLMRVYPVPRVHISTWVSSTTNASKACHLKSNEAGKAIVPA